MSGQQTYEQIEELIADLDKDELSIDVIKKKIKLHVN